MIELDDVRAGYVRGIDVLNGVSATFEPDRISSIVGPNGAGKSTLLKTIYGFADLHDGTITYEGDDLTAYSPSEMLRDAGIAYVPQERSVFPELSVHENLKLGTWTIRDDTKRTERSIENVYEQFPALEEKRRVRAGTLSGGQQRMLEIGRSLLTDPDVVFVDEPSAGLAPDLSENVYDSIARLRAQSVTVILVDQNIRAAVEYGDDLFIMEQGEIVVNEPTDDMTGEVENLVSEWISAKGEVA
ncbi:ABC transporter ATP-binding protein [Halobacteriales archaeon QS_5_70_15]|nr:MAG: ABC transporter ATP-binding protein [Halobacteriales archaeon QS_5_70_15]